jgi:hypothetical protein
MDGGVNGGQSCSVRFGNRMRLESVLWDEQNTEEGQTTHTHSPTFTHWQ